jgi:hypothetical protein
VLKWTVPFRLQIRYVQLRRFTGCKGAIINSFVRAAALQALEKARLFQI